MKFTLLGRTVYFYIGMGIALFFSLACAHYTQPAYEKNCRAYTVQIILEVDREAALELYYDIGRGFQEKDHHKSVITTADEKVVIQFTVPVWTALENIRIDPVGAGVHMKIYEISVVSSQDNYKKIFRLESITPIHQITNGHWDGVSYNFETMVDATDPMLLCEKLEAPKVKPKQKEMSVYVFWGVSAVCVVFLLNWIFRFFILGGKP